MDFDIKIIFWVLAIGFYIFTQIKDSLKKDNRTDPIPDAIPKLPSIPGMNTKRPEPKPIAVPTTTYSTPTPVKASKKYQNKYNREEEAKANKPFYTEEVKKPVVVNYEDPQSNQTERVSVFGVDQHLKPYELQSEKKHPLITFLSDKNNLKNAFITGEILKRPE